MMDIVNLLGKKDMGTKEFPAIETPLMDCDVAFCQHTGGHTPRPTGRPYLMFAERYFKGSGAARTSSSAVRR